ncbi:MAG: hypothetical protein KDA61_22210 [Planctomycetales bacterium]|nr:hypothetical protein [Planctomycetales bacterium]
MPFGMIYLACVAAIYAGLGVWCTWQPETTSRKVGFELVNASGRSEYVTVYGGLEIGLALVFAASLYRPETVSFGILASVLLHAALVVFRSVTLLRLEAVDSFTFKLAAGEWGLLLAGVVALWLTLRNETWGGG